MAFFSNKFCKKSLCFEILKVSWRELTNKKVVRLRVVMWGQCSASSGIRYDVSRAAVVEFADPDYQPGGSPRGRPSESSPGMPECGGDVRPPLGFVTMRRGQLSSSLHPGAPQGATLDAQVDRVSSKAADRTHIMS